MHACACSATNTWSPYNKLASSHNYLFTLISDDELRGSFVHEQLESAMEDRRQIIAKSEDYTMIKSLNIDRE
jgi:hypothetical protein